MALGVSRRALLASISMVFVAAFASSLVGKAASGQGTADGFRVMAREKSLAEQMLVLVNALGRKDIALFARGVALYAEAKAEFDGLITQLEHELGTSVPPAQSAAFEGELKAAVDKRVAFTSFVTDSLIPRAEASHKGVVGDFIKGGADLIKALTDSGVAIWHEFQSAGEARRKEIRQELEALRWPLYTPPAAE